MEPSLNQAITVKTGARLLETLTSALYADPIVVFREYVQNAIDSFSSSSVVREFKVNITIDFEQKRIAICDNGDGILVDKFDERMRSLGKSPKDGCGNQIGFRGIGRLAGLSFCNRLHFINRADPQAPKSFSLNGEEYRKILSATGGGNLDLDKVMSRIVSTDTTQTVNQCSGRADESGFEVVMEGVANELLDYIYLRKQKRGRQVKLNIDESVLPSSCKMPTEDFINDLSMLLPVPYARDFMGADIIRKKYDDWFRVDLASREFHVFLNGIQLFKPFGNSDGTDFQILPIQILDQRNDAVISSQALKTIGLLWMRFDYVFKAVKQNWGIAVRSKNMLVRGGSVLAEEAADDHDAITSYGQYLSAIKGVTGELLLETNSLSDNSRRDWFKVDKNSLQFRRQLCQLMNRMHSYRYKISRYMHNDMRTDAEKQSVVQAYRELVSHNICGSDMTAVEQYIADRFQKEDANEIDDRADERDILGYTMTQKRFYKTVMMAIYDYFENKEITDYYALKSHVLRSLNRDSFDSDDDSTTGER